jgi:hypothetical protein
MALDTHWRARLTDIQDAVLVAKNVNELAAAVLQLTAVLRDEWGREDGADLRQLLREAYDLLTNPESKVDWRDWTRAAAPIVGKRPTMQQAVDIIEAAEDR